MLADRFPDDRERGNAMGVALGGLALGVLGASFPFFELIELILWPLLFFIEKIYWCQVNNIYIYIYNMHGTRKGCATFRVVYHIDLES